MVPIVSEKLSAGVQYSSRRTLEIRQFKQVMKILYVTVRK